MSARSIERGVMVFAVAVACLVAGWSVWARRRAGAASTPSASAPASGPVEVFESFPTAPGEHVALWCDAPARFADDPGYLVGCEHPVNGNCAAPEMMLLICSAAAPTPASAPASAPAKSAPRRCEVAQVSEWDELAPNVERPRVAVTRSIVVRRPVAAHCTVHPI